MELRLEMKLDRILEIWVKERFSSFIVESAYDLLLGGGLVIGTLTVGALGYTFVFESSLLIVLEMGRFISWNLKSFLATGQPL